jgi:serine/threonine protein kinase
LIAALHRAGTATGEETERSVIEALMDRLRRLPAWGQRATSVDEDPAGRDFCAVLTPPAEPGELGRLGAYSIRRVLGSGGMGVVFEAIQDRPRRTVALKMILSGPHAGWQYLARFQSETEIVARLQHPNIVQVHEVGEHQGLPYFTMEYLDGGSLAQKLAIAPLPAEAAAELFETLARAVHFAHGRGFMHRDLKPANVLIGKSLANHTSRHENEREGGAGVRDDSYDWWIQCVPKIADFGLAKPLEGMAQEPGTPYRTETGAILGTPGYMAPEQAQANQAIGPAADIYALGAILYEALTGRPPFKAASLLETLEQVRTQEPVPISRLQPKVPHDLQTICLKCLHKDPVRRYASAADLADDLARFRRGEAIRARPVSRRERLWKWARRKPALAALIVVSGLSLLALIAGDLVYSARLRAAVQQATDSATEAHRQQRRAEAEYRAARDTLDRMRQRLESRRLGEVPQLKELQRALLEDQLTFYEGALGGADDPDPAVRRDTAWAHRHPGDIQKLLGRWPEAEQNLTRAIELVEALPAQEREAPDVQDLLARCYCDRGTFAGAPRFADAARDLTRALDICERLARAQPDDPGRQNELARVDHQLAGLSYGAGRLADAESHYGRAVALRTILVRDHPQNEPFQAALAEDYVNLGLLYAGARRTTEATAAYEKVESLLRPLVDRHPDEVPYGLSLAAGYVNWSSLLAATGQPDAALARVTRAVELAEDALRREPTYFPARSRAYNAHGLRAQICEGLGRFADAVKDWDRVVELDDLPDPWIRRAVRALALAAAGEHARATAEADALAADPKVSPDGLSVLAGAYSRSSRAAQTDARLPAAECTRLAERYASRAIALLQKIQRQGYFKDAAHAKTLRTDEDFQPLRGREDFQKLLANEKSDNAR